MERQKETIHSITVEYGDALFRLYQIQLNADVGESHQVIHGHRFYELHWAKEGSYTYEVGEQRIPVSRHHMLIIPPDIPHISVGVPMSDSYRYAVLSLSLDKIDKPNGEEGFYGYFRQTLDAFSLRALPISPELVRRVTELCRSELYDDLRGSCYLKMQASALLFTLFDSLNGFHTDSAPLHGEWDEQNRLVLLDTLVNQADRSLSDIASAIHYSPRHTARLIRRIYGVSLTELRKKRNTGERI